MEPEDMPVSTSSIDSFQHQINKLGGTLEDANTQLRSLLLLMAPDISNSIPFHLDSLDMFEFLLSINDKILNSKLQIKKLSEDFQKHADKPNSTTAENVEERMVVPKVKKRFSQRVSCTFPEPNIVLGRREIFKKSSCNKDQFQSDWKSEVKEITCREHQPELKDTDISHVDQDLSRNLRRSSSCIDLSKYVKLDTKHNLVNSNANIINEDNEQMVEQIIKDLITSLDLVPTAVQDCDFVFRIEDVIETLRSKKAKKRSRISSRIMSGFRRIRKVMTRSLTVCFGRKNTV